MSRATSARSIPPPSGRWTSGDYEQAAKLFDEVERQHPYSVWARRAQLMSAFNYYLAKKYTEAISSAQRFVTIHPGNAEAPYAQYLDRDELLRADRRRHPRPGDHPAASDAFGELIRRYPESRYASDARLKLDLDQRSPRRQGNGDRPLLPALGPMARGDLSLPPVVDKYQTTSHTPEALERLVECYLALGIPDEAQKAAAVLGANYPDTYWYRQSLRLLGAESSRPHAAADGLAEVMPTASGSSHAEAARHPQRRADRAARARFEPGLGVLTGETGAGKSILLDALGLALGARADSGLVRAGEARPRSPPRSSCRPIIRRSPARRAGHRRSKPASR